MATLPTRVADFPDLLPLRDRNDARVGLYSDHGSWTALCWGARGGPLLELHDTRDASLRDFDLGSPARHRTVFLDRLEAELEDGSRIRAACSGPEAVLVEFRGPGRPRPSCPLPWRIRSSGPGCWEILIAPGTQSFPLSDPYVERRHRMDGLLARCLGRLRRPEEPLDRLVAARALTTLLWNRRVHSDTAGIIPSPFGYRGFWAWDSWKHAHALAPLLPGLALAQLHAQADRQRADGMIPDTVMPDPARDNWRNGKPPLLAWALAALARQGVRPDRLTPLRARAASHLDWWWRERRPCDEELCSCGGRDRESATWDGGWDHSLRYAGVPLRPHHDWRLFDLWQPDLNTALAVEWMVLGQGRRAARLARAIRRSCWDDALGCYGDRRPRGSSTGVRSLACCWPVAAGIATLRQREATRSLLSDPRHFATPFPFPALAVSEHGFDPDGYWNGGVWMDHAVLACAVLGPAAADPTRRLLEGVAAAGPLWECYHPYTARPCGGSRPASPQFSWTAAALLELLCRPA